MRWHAKLPKPMAGASPWPTVPAVDCASVCGCHAATSIALGQARGRGLGRQFAGICHFARIATVPHSAPPLLRHRPYEDLLALLTGTLFPALGIVMFRQAGLLTGGTTGVAFLVHYATHWNLGLVLFVVNTPFYILAWRRMGPQFTLKTVSAVALLSAWVNVLPLCIGFTLPSAPFTAILGGLMMGTGILILFRHHASLGGFNILALYLQEHRGWRAGKVQMALDLAILVAAFASVDWRQVALSVLGALVLNQVLTTNHQPGRYLPL